MERSKASFRFTRERIGMTQGQLADACEVDVRSVKRWEQPFGKYDPPAFAWAVLEEMKSRYDSVLNAAEEAVIEQVSRFGSEGGTVALRHWHDEEEFLAERDEEDGPWTVVNAMTIELASRLDRLGIDYDIVGFEFDFDEDHEDVDDYL